jgi:two-component system, cell cycle sensor histidine kinase and response regulator CckA
MMNCLHLGKKLLLRPIQTAQHDSPHHDADALRRARNVLIIALGLAGVCLAMLISALLRVPPSPGVPILVTGIAIALIIGLLVVEGWVRLAALLLVLAPLPLLILAVADHGQLLSTPYFCTLSLVIAGMTMRPRGVGLAFLCALATLALLGVLSAGVVQIQPPPGSQLINAAILMSIVALVAALGANSAAHSLRTMHDREQQARQVEQALRESEERYRLIAENTSDLIALLDAEGRYLYASPSHAAELGHEPTSLIGALHRNLIHPDDQLALVAHWRQARRRGGAQGSYRVAHADGSWRWLEVHLTAAMRQGQQYVVLVARDITARLALETQFQQAQKLEALGRLASGVAHDFNNLLVVIAGSAELAAATLPADHEAHVDLVAVQQASRRASALTRQLLAFARRQAITPRFVYLDEVIRDISRMLERLLGEDITLVIHIAPDVWPVWVDPGQIEQVLMNMAVNARDAMPTGGALTIAVENTLHAPSQHASVKVTPTPYVCLTIADTGIGMSEEVQGHLFEPFYTTKAPDKGTGLGLATCYGIVTQIGGDITVESVVGAGTTFTILLLRTVAVPDNDDSSHELAGPQGGRETVLVVEDDPHVRDLIVRIVRAHNYIVLEAGEIDTALTLARQHLDAIHMLVADLGLPGMNGAALAEAVREIIPSVKVLLISGYAEYTLSTQDGLLAGTAFLPKPFSAAALAAKLHEALSSQRSGGRAG